MSATANSKDNLHDTGIPWIGVLPASWQTKRVKHVAYVKARVGWHALSTDEFTSEGPHLVTGTDFEDGQVRWDRCHRVSETRFNQDPYIQLRPGDLLVTKDGTIGKLAVVHNGMPSRATLNSGIFVTRPLRGQYNSQFFYWVLGSRIFSTFVDLTKVGSTINHLYQKELAEFSFPIPPLPTQRAIADFLDRKTRAIDALIRKKERLIELLQEKRQALITQAVTKGLDPNVPMKDSGVPWLGEIPAHWELKRVRHAVRIANQNRVPVNRSDRAEMQGIYPYWGPTGVLDHIDVYRFDGAYALIGEDGDHFTKFSTWDMTQWATGRFNVNNHAHVIASGAKCTARWFYWSFRHRDVGGDLIAQGVSRLKLTNWALSNLWLAVPPVPEQTAICRFLDDSETGSRNIVATVEKAASALREYRQALISAAVTGQIDVTRGAAA